MTLIRKDIDNIDAYKPGKPIEEVKRELGLKDVIKLASNENSLGTSPKALKAIRRAAKNTSRYPEGSCYVLRKRLAGILETKEENLLFGNGSDELIDVILKTIKSADAEIITSDITFVEYKISALINGFSVLTVPLKNFRFDLESIAARITPKTKAVFIANPNNPTGTYVAAQAVDDFLKKIPPDVLVVFDEAYMEYVDADDFPQTLALLQNRNIAILRTFSKAYGLAGLRVGYMIAGERFVAAAQRIRLPFNVNSLAQAAACAALDDRSFIRKSRELVLREKQFLYTTFTKMGIWFEKSAANFIFVKTPLQGSALFTRLLKKGVIIREMGQYQLNQYARITIGTRKENLRLIRALKDVLRAKN